MDQLAAIGLSWKHEDLEQVARFSAAEGDRPARASALAERLGVEELLLLVTCNRVEVLFVPPAGESVAALRTPVYDVLAGRPPSPGEAERTFRAWSGEGAVEHALLVASGLDSAQLGETEISGQVRRAAEEARAQALLGPRLSDLVERALRLSRRVRRETALGLGRTSLAELALDAVRDRLLTSGGGVALVGVSPMTERCARDLSAEGVPLVLVNRTIARAEKLAASLSKSKADSKADSTVAALDDFAAAPAAVEAVVCATGAEHAVLSRGALERMASRVPSGRSLLVVDLAVPADVDPDDAKAAGVERVGLDLLTARAAATREARLAAAAEARILVDQALDTWRDDETERLLGPVLAAMQRHYQATAHAGVERLLRRELTGLGDEQRDAVERWAAALARRFAHLPASGLRAVVRDHGGEALDTFLSRADDSLGQALREAREDPS